MNRPAVLITRPQGDETLLKDELQARGYRVIHEPMSEIFLLHDARHALEYALAQNPDAVLVTSQHAVRALAALTPLRDIPLLCVGEATLHSAELNGFSRTCATGGDSAHMVEYILSAYDPESSFVYVSARDVRSDLVAELASHQMQIERVIVYTAEAITQLSDTLSEQLRRGQIPVATFFSARASEIFVRLLAQHGLAQASQSMVAYTLSKAVARPLEALSWQAIHVADEPTLASLLESVDNES